MLVKLLPLLAPLDTRPIIKALQREVLRQEIEAALAGRPSKQRFRELAERLLELAA